MSAVSTNVSPEALTRLINRQLQAAGVNVVATKGNRDMDIALKIPRPFWPDRTVGGVWMFDKVELDLDAFVVAEGAVDARKIVPAVRQAVKESGLGFKNDSWEQRGL